MHMTVVTFGSKIRNDAAGLHAVKRRMTTQDLVYEQLHSSQGNLRLDKGSLLLRSLSSSVPRTCRYAKR
jgi:hypothetical protein